MKFTKDQWLGNKWPSIDIDPYKAWQFLAVLTHLHVTYRIELPPIYNTLDGYGADFRIGDCEVMMSMDNWTFSIAFADEAVRDAVFEELTSLPPDFFSVPGQDD